MAPEPSVQVLAQVPNVPPEPACRRSIDARVLAAVASEVLQLLPGEPDVVGGLVGVESCGLGQLAASTAQRLVLVLARAHDARSSPFAVSGGTMRCASIQRRRSSGSYRTQRRAERRTNAGPR